MISPEAVDPPVAEESHLDVSLSKVYETS
jgi:hypothetical protein